MPRNVRAAETETTIIFDANIRIINANEYDDWIANDATGTIDATDNNDDNGKAN